MVKGDLIIPTSNRIMTRSQAKANPDKYTIIPAPLKIIKVLIEELLSASGAQNAAMAAAAAEFADEEGDDDGWEDVPSTLDLGLGSTKADLMAYGDGMGSAFGRQRDDETQAYLTEFFMKACSIPPFNTTCDVNSIRRFPMRTLPVSRISTPHFPKRRGRSWLSLLSRFSNKRVLLLFCEKYKSNLGMMQRKCKCKLLFIRCWVQKRFACTYQAARFTSSLEQVMVG